MQPKRKSLYNLPLILCLCKRNFNQCLCIKEDLQEQDIRDIYTKYYQNNKFIRLLPPQSLPQTRWVKSSNFADINFSVDQRTKRVIVLGAIDNLIKGAAGQAVQNMNLMFDFDEDEGLKFFANL